MSAIPPGAPTAVAMAPDGLVPAWTIGSGVPVVLAHGAGAGPGHPFVTGIAARLAEAGFAVISFAYPYVAEGRKAPDRLDRLIAAHTAVVAWAAETHGMAPFLAGKSMGARVGSHLGGVGPGQVFFGYPLVAIGKTEPRDSGHLRGPMLFIQGARDRLTPIEMVRALVARLPEAELEVVAEADHGFAVPKRTGIDPEEMLDHLATVAAAWMRRRV